MKRISNRGDQVEREVTAAKIEVDERRATQNDQKMLRIEPSHPKKVHCLDILENPKFCGREKLLGLLKEQILLESNSPRKGASVLIHGLGGVGKSELALKFIYDHIAIFPYVFWITADTAQKLNLGATKACMSLMLGVEGLESDPSRAVALLKGWLLDNGTSPDVIH